MNKTDRLVIATDTNLKKKFLATVKKDGRTASYIIRQFMTDFTTKGTARGKKSTRAAKNITQ